MCEENLPKTVEKKDKKFNIKLENFSVNFVLILSIIIMLFLFISSFLYTAYFWNSRIDEYHEGLYYEQDNILLNLCGVSAFLLVVFGIYKIFSKTNKKVLIILSLALIGILGFAWVNFVQAPVKSDQGAVLRGAIKFMNGDYSYLDKPKYLYMHPLQLGCVLGMELIIRIIHTSSWIALQNTNIVFLLGCSILIMLITKKLYNKESTNRILNILMMFFLVIPLYGVVVYGNIFGLFFSLLAIFFLLKFYEEYKIRYMFLIAFSLSVAIVFKSNYEIVMIGILISLLLDIIHKFKLKTLLTVILILVCFGISYPIVYKIVEIRSGKEVNDGIPMLTYIAMAIQEPVSRNSGWYHDTKNVETIYPGNNFDSEATIEESKEIIKNRLKEFYNSPKTAVKFYLDKIASTWIEPAFQTLWWSEPLEVFASQSDEYKEYITNNKVLLSILHGKLHTVLLRYLDVVEITIFSMSALSVIFGIKNKNINYKNFILILIFIGGFFFHIIWETKSIYVIPFYVMLLPSAADGIDEIRMKLCDKLKKLKEN